MKCTLSFLFCCLLTSGSQAATDKYRIILLDDPSTTITIAWNQISGNNQQVYYDVVDHGTNTANYANSKTPDRSTNYRGMSNQFVNLTGLQPNTNYYFVIEDSQGTSARYWFRTAPSDNARLSFISGGDSRNNRTPRRNANKLVAKLKPHAVFFNGDMIDDDVNTEWQDWFDDWQLTTASDGRMIPIVPARGNHEDAGTIRNLFNTPVDSYYAITWGDDLIRTYTLNSEISTLGNQLTWLENDFQAHPTPTWKMAQYHKPMRPHTFFKSEGSSEYSAWAQLFFDNNVRLVVDSDSHCTKTTWPIEPSSGAGSDEGFIRNDNFGTVYAGEGCWGAPLRTANDDKSWTRNSGSFNQFCLIFVGTDKMELRVIQTDNADVVGEVSNTDAFTLPNNLDIWNPSNGSVVEIFPALTCPAAGTVCDDGDADTIQDEEDGFCNCVGIPCGSNTIESTINSTYNDVEEASDGDIDAGSSDLELVDDTSFNGDDQTVGIRFTDLDIPQGATITNAYIQFTVDENDSETTSLTIQGEDVDDAAIFTDVDYDVSTRTRTTASVAWNNIPAWSGEGTSGLDQRTPDLKSIVQEIVNRATWQKGNAMAFLITGNGQRTAESFNGVASSAPRLVIDFDVSCGNCPPAGTACDDGDSSTFDDLEDGNCNCIGLPCPAIGTACDDNNSNTINDLEDGNCNCAGVLCGSMGTVDVAITSGGNDVEEAEDGTINDSSSDLELVDDPSFNGNDQTVGLRFTNVGVPIGATITSAYIQFTVDQTDAVTTNLVIRGEDVDNATAFTDIDFSVSTRTRTTAVVNWNNIPAWTLVGAAGADQRTPDLTTIVQEIVDRSGWLNGNAMTFIITGDGERTAEAYDGVPASAPTLHIEYTVDCPSNCEPIVTLDNQTLTSTTIQASDEIRTANTVTVPSGATVTFDAGNLVHLQAGFSAANGSTFTAKIGGCTAPLQPIASRSKQVAIPKIDLLLAPNPARDFIGVHLNLFTDATVSAQVLNIQGQTIRSIYEEDSLTAGRQHTKIPTNDLPSGTYFLVLQYNGIVVTESFVIAKD